MATFPWKDWPGKKPVWARAIEIILAGLIKKLWFLLRICG